MSSVAQAPSDAPGASLSGLCRIGAHRWRTVGYARESARGPVLDCAQPLRVVCERCPETTEWRCGCHRASRCPPCAGRFRARLVRVAESGANRSDGWSYFLTLTAPGERPHRQWVADWDRTSPRPPCTCDQVLDAGREGLARWNASASKRWARLRRDLRRTDPVQFLRVVEVQRRGALHLHVLVWSPVPLDGWAVQKLALRAGFGCSYKLVEMSSERHAHYVGKYATKSCEDRGSTPWGRDVVRPETGEVRFLPAAPTFRVWSRSAGYGISMRALVLRVRARHAALAADERGEREVEHQGDEHGGGPAHRTSLPAGP